METGLHELTMPTTATPCGLALSKRSLQVVTRWEGHSMVPQGMWSSIKITSNTDVFVYGDSPNSVFNTWGSYGKGKRPGG